MSIFQRLAFILLLLRCAPAVGQAVPQRVSPTLLVGQVCGGAADLILEGRGAVISAPVGNVYLGGGGVFLVLANANSTVRCVVCGGEGPSWIFSAGPLPGLVRSTPTSACEIRPLSALRAEDLQPTQQAGSGGAKTPRAEPKVPRVGGSKRRPADTSR